MCPLHRHLDKAEYRYGIQHGRVVLCRNRMGPVYSPRKRLLPRSVVVEYTINTFSSLD